MKQAKYRSWNGEKFYYFLNGGYFYENGKVAHRWRFDWENAEQFIGSCDSKNTELYKGDIVVIDNEYPFYDEGKLNYIGIIEWVFSGWQVVLKIVNSDKRGISDGANHGYLEDSEYYTKIGNIHENPELLNEVEK